MYRRPQALERHAGTCGESVLGQNGNSGKQFWIIVYDPSGVPYHSVLVGNPASRWQRGYPATIGRRLTSKQLLVQREHTFRA